MPKSVIKSATIVGGGFNGIPYYNKLDYNNTVVLCSNAIQILDPTKQEPKNVIWFISDWKTTRVHNFDVYHKAFKHILWGSGQVADRVSVQWEYQENPPFNHIEQNLLIGVYRSGATVVGTALQHLIQHGYNKVVLCGVDMCGTRTTTNLKHRYNLDHWNYSRGLLQQLIEEHMPNTTTLSPTTLDIRKEQL